VLGLIRGVRAVLRLCDEVDNGEWDEAPRPRDIRHALNHPEESP